MPRYERSYVGERRSEFVGIQLTPAEREELETAAKGQGASLSHYARELMFRHSAVVAAAPRRNPEAAALLRELRHSGNELHRIGNNLNQVAMRSNMAGQLEHLEVLYAALADYRSVSERHKQAISRVLDL